MAGTFKKYKPKKVNEEKLKEFLIKLNAEKCKDSTISLKG